MKRFYLEITCQVHGIPAEEVYDNLADAVHDLTDVKDQDLGANLAEGTFDFCLTVDASGEAEALGRGLAAVRTAVHAAGGSTPGWEQHFRRIKNVVRPVEPVPAC